MGNFYTDVIQKDARFNSPQPCRDTALLEPVTRAAVAAIIAEAAQSGIKLIVTETFRSQALQLHDEAIGASQVKVGVHHYGLGCDFARIEGGGKCDWSTADWQFLGPLAAKHGMTWGGDWGDPKKLHEPGFHDWDHIQRVAVEQQTALFAGTWYPEETTT